MAQINIRIDDVLKEEGEQLFKSLGLTFSSAVSVFVSQAVREGGIPFPLTLETDRFYSKNNMNALHHAIQEIRNGKVVTKTMNELLAMEK